jgi:hypothetical protein
MHADFRLDLDLETLAAESGYSRAHFPIRVDGGSKL